jgi:GntR family transcriptional regulator / MocR family aminotransferase
VPRAPVSPVPVRVDRRSAVPLPAQLAVGVRDLVVNGVLAGGSRLPSTRALARELQVSRGVVEQAFDQLTAEGWLVGRRGAGTFVAAGAATRSRAEPPRGEPARAGEAARSAPVDVVVLDTGTPWIDPRHDAGWRRAWRDVAARVPSRRYPDPVGLPELRAAVAERLGRHRGLTCTADEVLIVAGTTHGLGLLLDSAGAGAVALEDPGYRAAAAAVRASGRELVDVPVDDEGIDVSVLAGVTAELAAVYVSPAHQHPLGMTMSGPRRFALLREARRRGCLVVEDDYDSEFRYDVAPLPAMAPLDRDRVVYLGTVSKTVSPALRLGWLVSSSDRVQQLGLARAARHDHPSEPVQQALLSMLEQGHFDRLVRSARRVYARRRELVRDRLAPYGEVAAGAAGMYLTLGLPTSTAARVAADAAGEGVAVSRLRAYCRTSSRDGLVIGFGGPTDAQLERAVEVLERLLAQRPSATGSSPPGPLPERQRTAPRRRPT